MRAAPLGEADALRVKDGMVVNRGGERVTFFGVNLFESHLMWSRRQDPGPYEKELPQIAEFGFNALRMPLNMSWFEPKPGVFPDHPEYEATLTAHKLPTGALAFYDGLIRRAGELGLYVIPEFHELPSNPYRWFVGGNEKDKGTGKPGTAIAWMAKKDEKGRYEADPELALTEVPKALAWLTTHWRGVPNIAGIEVPWNEPGGPLTRGEAYYELVDACAKAVKAADPDRLVFMDAVDWGAMVNYMSDESTWRIPQEVDVLFPHFYPGMHSNDSGADGTWSTTMASWSSWLAGSGKPLMVGEFGLAGVKRAKYWQGDVGDLEYGRVLAGSAAQWHAMGLDGIFCWAWKRGLGNDLESGILNQGADQLVKWSEAQKNNPNVFSAARIAVVCTPRNRAQYGKRADLWSISHALLGVHLTPFATIFTTQVAAQADCLGRFDVVLVLDKDLPEDVSAKLRGVKKPVAWIKPDLSNLADAVALARKHVEPAGNWPGSVFVGMAPGEAVVFERAGQDGPVRLQLAIPGAEGTGRLVDSDDETLYEGTAAKLGQDGFTLPLKPWQCVRLRWIAAQ
jgi:hypothetical protein